VPAVRGAFEEVKIWLLPLAIHPDTLQEIAMVCKALPQLIQKKPVYNFIIKRN